MAADIEELGEMDASELHARRLNAKEALTPHRSGNFIFPVADGTVKIFGAEQRLRKSTLTRDCPERGEEQEILQGKSDELQYPTPVQEDSTRDDEEAKSDFSTVTRKFIYRHHVVPRVKLYVPKEESFPFPLKYIDVTRTSNTLKINYWNVNGGRKIIGCMDRLHMICSAKGKATRRIHMVGLSRNQSSTTPDC